MNTRNSFSFLMGGFAVLSLAVVSTTPLSAEIAQREVYRDASTTTVDAASTEEFAKLYNTGQAKIASEGFAKEFNGSPELRRAIASKDFQRLLMQSNEFQRLLMQSTFQRINLSKDFQRLMQSNEFQRLMQSKFQRLMQSNEFQRLMQSNEFQRLMQ